MTLSATLQRALVLAGGGLLARRPLRRRRSRRHPRGDPQRLHRPAGHQHLPLALPEPAPGRGAEALLHRGGRDPHRAPGLRPRAPPGGRGAAVGRERPARGGGVRPPRLGPGLVRRAGAAGDRGPPHPALPPLQRGREAAVDGPEGAGALRRHLAPALGAAEVPAERPGGLRAHERGGGRRSRGLEPAPRPGRRGAARAGAGADASSSAPTAGSRWRPSISCGSPRATPTSC